MKKINTALCSFGMSGLVFHAPFLDLHPGFNLYGVWERSKNVAREKYPSIETFRTLEELLADEAIELVIVNTPNNTHYDYAKKSLLAGKHTVVEKSFTVTANEAEELIKISEEKNLTLSVFQNRRYDSDFKTVKKIYDEGVLGEIVEAEFHYDRFNQTLSYKQHKEIKAPGAGVLHDLGPHLIDQALFLFGMPQEVFCQLRIVRPLSAVSDYMDIFLYYPKLIVRLKSSYIVKEPIPSFALHGINGSFLKVRADVQEADLISNKKPGNKDWGSEPDSAAGILNLIENGETIRKNITSEQGNYLDFYEGVYKAFINEAPLPVTARDGLNVMKIIEAALQSNEKDCKVKL